MTSEETLRAAAMDAIARFCELQGFPVPELNEQLQGRIVRFVGRSPEGREFAIGYELPPPPDPTLHASTSPGPVNCSVRKWWQGEPVPTRCERCGVGSGPHTLANCPFFIADGSKRSAQG